MGKKQHSKDRMFITKTEWATEWGGAKSKDTSTTPFKRLPLYCCSLTFTPFEVPVCTSDGSVFDLMSIVPYINKYGRNPVTGGTLKLDDLIPLTFHKNSQGEFHCPVLGKVFTEFTHIAAVKTTGNVFCYEAIKELNLKPKNWKELLTDEPFTRDDLVTIQNPNDLDSKVFSEFDHVKHGLRLEDDELKKMKEDPTYNINVNVSGDIKQMLEELGTEKATEAALLGGGGSKAQKERAAALAVITSAAARSRLKEDSKPEAPRAFSIVDAASASVHGRSAAAAAKAGSSDKTAARVALHMAGERAPVNAKLVKSQYTNGAASRSFTSTSYDPVTKNDQFEYVRAEKNPKKKGYVQLHTTHGDLNLELHCDVAPRACENFITLCERGYYNGTVFHRSVKNFMIQGGDPTGTGRGGQSIWGKPFEDELNSKLLHSGRGVVSMANSGVPHTNGSQFFVLYKSAKHLDFKHTVFGGVVGGMETLRVMERVPVDDVHRCPKEEIRIESVKVFVNPYTEPDEDEDKEEKTEEEKRVADAGKDRVGSWFSNPGTGATGSVAVGGGVGKYLKSTNMKTEALGDKAVVSNGSTKKRKAEVSVVEYKKFSGW